MVTRFYSYLQEETLVCIVEESTAHCGSCNGTVQTASLQGSSLISSVTSENGLADCIAGV